MGHNHTAFAREDVEDAQRGAPTTSLDAWASERGLAFRGSELLGSFEGLLPRFPDYIFNACQGELSPGRFGQVAHQLEELSATDGEIDGGGTFYGTRLNTKRGLLSFIGIEGDPPDEPFKANAVWAPTTAVVLRVPEVVLLPRLVIRTAAFLSAVGDRTLGAFEMPGLRQLKSRWVDPPLADLVATAARPLAGLPAAYVSMVVDHGVLSVVCNGFVADPAALDHLVATAVTVAETLATIVPVPDGTPPWCGVPSDAADAFRQVCDNMNLRLDDPVAFHRAVRRTPFPGRALGLVYGTLPGTEVEGRLAFAVPGGRLPSYTYRTVVIANAAPGATTPVGGIVHAPTGQYAEVVDGLAYSWPQRSGLMRLDSVERSAAGIQTLRDLTLAPL